MPIVKSPTGWQQVLDVMSGFGAVGDNAAKDGDPLKNAIAFGLANQVGTVKIKIGAGTFKMKDSVGAGTGSITMDFLNGFGDLIIEGEGRGLTTLNWADNPGNDAYGNLQAVLNPINCGIGISVVIRDLTIQLPSIAGTTDPNGTVTTTDFGAAIRVPNRCSIERVNVTGGYAGLLHDGVIDLFLGTGTVTPGSATITGVTTTAGSLSDPQIIGSTIYIASGAVAFPSETTVSSIGVGTVTLSAAATGAAPATATFGLQISQDTDHFLVSDINLRGMRDGVYCTRNANLRGGGSIGSRDFIYRKVNIGQTQRAGFVASDTGYFPDVTFEDVHVANVPYSFLKEGTYGVSPTQSTFLDNCTFVRCKAEGSGNAAILDQSGLSHIQFCSGNFELHQVQVNAGETNKKITIYNQTYYDYRNVTGQIISPAAGIGTITGLPVTVVTGTTSGTALTALTPALDQSYVGAVITGSVITGTVTITQVAANGLSATLSATASGGTGVSLTIGNHGLRVGSHVAMRYNGSPGSPSTDQKSFVDSGIVASLLTPSSVTVDLQNTTRASGAAVAIDIGLIWGQRVGSRVNEQIDWDIRSDASTADIATELFWDIDGLASCRWNMLSAQLPILTLRGNGTAGGTFERTMGCLVTAGAVECVVANVLASSATIPVGSALQRGINGARSLHGGGTAGWGGFARTPGSPTTSVSGLIVSRPYLLAQMKGPMALNDAAASSAAPCSGVACAAGVSTGQYLCGSLLAVAGTTFTATTTNGSTAINTFNNAGSALTLLQAYVGAPITGTSIVTGTYIAAISPNGSSATLSQAAGAGAGAVSVIIDALSGGQVRGVGTSSSEFVGGGHLVVALAYGAVSGGFANGEIFSEPFVTSRPDIGYVPPTPREATLTSNATWAPNADSTDIFTVTAQAVAASTISNPSGAPSQGQRLVMRIKDNGTARALTWSGGQWRASSSLPLPTTTIAGKTLYLEFVYNATDTKWDLLLLLNNF